MRPSTSSVRRKVYRGEDGWLMIAADPSGRTSRIFFLHESAARRTAQRIKMNPRYETSLEDFNP